MIADVWGSARVSRAGERVLAIANFLRCFKHAVHRRTSEVRFGATPKPKRETRALPKQLRSRQFNESLRFMRILIGGISLFAISAFAQTSH